MQLSSGNRTKFEDDFGKLNATSAALIRGSSVVLSTGRFNGSGVIFTFNSSGTNTITYIMTAKHNLLLGNPYVPGTTPAPSTMVAAFSRAITIRYGAADFATKPPNSAIFDEGATNGGNINIFGGRGAPDDWKYDVMMLQSSDAGLLAQAKNYALVKRKSDLMTQWAVLDNPGLALKRIKENDYIQTGFGYSSDAQSLSDSYVGKFQVRFTEPKNKTVAEAVYSYDEDKDKDQEFQNIVVLNADDDSSTAPGDSGGPLFLVDNKSGTMPPPVYLLAVTLGANQSLEEKTVVPDTPIVSNTSSYLRSFLCGLYPTTLGC